MNDPRRSSRLLDDREELARPFHSRKDEEVQAETVEIDPIAEAHARGLVEGRESGLADASAAFEKAATRMRGSLADALRELDAARTAIETACVVAVKRLALQAASAMLREKIAEDDPVAVRALRDAVHALPGSERLVIRIHTDDAKALRAEFEDEIAADRFEFVADEGIERGGCIVESAAGTIDATVETAEAATRGAVEDRVETS